MAKFKQNNVELRDNQKLIFDSTKSKYMSYDGAELFVNSTVSGVDPTIDEHLTTKYYVDAAITTATGSLTSDHGDLTGLGDDDHPHYAKQAVFATHSGNSDIHYEQSAISITESQISDLGDYIDETEMTTISGDLVSGYIAADVVLDTKIDTTSGTLQDEIDAIVFGTEYYYNSSDAESSTTADTPQQKLRLTTGSLPSGTYHIEWGYEFNVDDNKDSEFNAQVQINDTTTIAAQGNNAQWKTSTIWIAQSGFYDAVLSGVLNIDTDYWDSAGAGVSMRRARTVIWRVL